jgi:AcrR family transcriptional regulator
MRDNDRETREKIMEHTLKLIESESDYSGITVRRIASAAGVNLSAVNYHFGSKEKLIGEVVKTSIVAFLSSKGSLVGQYAGEPARRLKELLKLPARFLAENPNISRISILSDMTNPLENDLSEQTIKFLEPAFRETFPRMGEHETGLELWKLVSTIQTAFLRSGNFNKLTGVDYFSDRERDEFLERCIDALAEKNGGN